MARRWREPSAFRADPSAEPPGRPTRRQAVALIAVLVTVAAGIAAASYLVRPEKARAFELFHGSVFLSDQNSPVAVDLASGKPTLRLLGAGKQVGINDGQSLGVVPLVDHTLLVNAGTGEFNMVDNSGFVVKHDGGGVPLGRRPGTSTSFGVAAAGGQGYIVRTGARGGTDVYLVGQPTVESAIGATGSVRPRASGSIAQPVSAGAGGTASANGDLWLLAGAVDGLRTIRRLHVPEDSSTGAALAPSEHGRVNGAAAIGSATTARDGTGADVVGVASSSRIDLFVPGSGVLTRPFAVPDGVDEILPSSNAHGRLAFLIHGRAGWYVVSVDADGTNLRAPDLITELPAGAALTSPAVSESRMYTMDKGDGAFYQIGFDGSVHSVDGAARYPLATVGAHTIEPAGFADAYVLARGPRVVFNSADHVNALMVFTDGSHAPRIIAKSSAVTVNAAGGAEALARTAANADEKPGKQPVPGQPKPKPQQLQPINTKIDCKTVTQKPHIPVITSAVPGSRTVTLSWSYPLISVQDCVPSTYLVTAKVLDDDAPPAPASVTVQSQTGAVVAGLFPGTQYEISVLAYINGEGTPSLPVRIATGEEGPAAPVKLAVATDASGNWQLSWDSCGTVAASCVPAQSWTVTPNFCDGRGVSAPPAPISVTADASTAHQPPATYPGNDELLGRGLQFQVHGTGLAGQAGSPSVKSPCVRSWTPPVVGNLSVLASSPAATTSSEDTTTTTATVRFAQGRVHDLGGVGATLTYELLSGSAVIDTVGPTTKSSVTLHGIRAAEHYQVRVGAQPPGHPEAAATIAAVDVVAAIADWPRLVLAAPSFTAPAGQAGTLHVSFGFAANAGTRGETFDLVNSRLVCGNTALELTRADVAPGADMSFQVDRSTYNGPCKVSIQLAQNSRTATSPPLYGAGNSAPATSAGFDIDPPSLTSTAGDFEAKWGGSNGQPTVVVSYHGADSLAGTADWQLRLSNGSADCGTAGAAPPVTIDVDKSCVRDGGTFTVTVDFSYFVVAHPHFEVPVDGDAPTPVDPRAIDFSASWNANAGSPRVTLDYLGSAPLAALGPLEWTETVTSSTAPGVVCGAAEGNPAEGTVSIDVDLAACPPADPTGTPAVYTVDISFTDPTYGVTGDYVRTVDGTPPQ